MKSTVFTWCPCSKQAEKKVYARLDSHLQRKRRGEAVTLVVAGCVAQQEGEALLRAVPEARFCRAQNEPLCSFLAGQRPKTEGNRDETC